MLQRPKRSLEVISISALDLFASALGVFILMAVVLFPYYLRQPSVDKDLEGARAKMNAAGLAMTKARQVAEEAEQEMAAAEELRSRATDELQRALASKAEADKVLAIAARRAEKSEKKKASKKDQDAKINVPQLDLVFVMDTTGSMREEISDLQSNLLGIVRILQRLAPSLNVGFIAYRDRGEQYVTRSFPLVPMTDVNLRRLQAFVERLRARGGGDIPEAVELALSQSLGMPWRKEAFGWIIVMGDAPAHRRGLPKAFEAAQRFQYTSNPVVATRRVSAIYTGKGVRRREAILARDFFQRLALLGGGDFIDHEGQMIESVLMSVLGAK